MLNSPFAHTLPAVLFAVLLLGLANAGVTAADDPLHKVGTTAMTAALYATDGTVAAKPAELIDGNPATRWIWRTPEQYLPLRLVFDMGVARTVGKLRIANYYTGQNFERGFKGVEIFVGDALPPATGGTPVVAEMQVAISTKDGPAWTEIALKQPVKGRYVSVRVKSNWGGSSYAANEVEIYTVEADAPSAATTPKTTPDTPKTTGQISVTQYDNAGGTVGTPKELIDHDPATRWMFVDNGKPELMFPIRLCFDLGTAQKISRVRIANYCTLSHANFERGIKTVDLFVGDALAPATGGTPTVADTRITISNADGPVWTVIDLPQPVLGRYVTLRVKDNWGAKNYAANEVEIVTVPVEPVTKPSDTAK